MNVGHLVWWAIGAYGLNACLLGVAIFVFGWPAVIGSKLGRIALGFALVGLSLLAVEKHGERKGRSDERERQGKENEEYLEQLAKDDAARDRLPDDELDRVLGQPRDTQGRPAGG